MTGRSWAHALVATIALQWSLVIGIAFAAWPLLGGWIAASCLAGGGAVIVPNSLLAAYLWFKARRVRALSVASFLGGEMVKLLGTLVALYGVARLLGTHVSWPALVVGVICALKGQWLALWFTRNL